MTAETTFLCDDLVAIRPWRAADAQPAFDAILESRAETAMWLADVSRVASVAEVEDYIVHATEEWTNESNYNFAIVDAQDTTFLGSCGLTQVNRRHLYANLYYWVRTSQTGRGIASRATRLAARFGCEVLGLQRIEVVVEVDNIASLRAAAKAGAVHEGVLRNRLNSRGAARNAVMFSFVPSDFDL